ncbi:MAG: hypothetical protein IJI67_06275 [Clostridia bacterium]|nr:hypothetical protein [Clostridia bacterium]
MSIFKIIYAGEEEDEEFSSYEAADEYGLYMQSCEREGAEILNLSNPGDYDYDEDEFEPQDYEVIEIE